MKTYNQGDASRAICEDCGLVQTTFKIRPVRVGARSEIFILVGVCYSCGIIVSTPPQATPAIKLAFEDGYQNEP